MKKYLYSIILAGCFIFYSCTKQGTENVSLPRLQKIITNGVDSLGNDCNTCLYYQFFKYDTNGRLIKITDSSAAWYHFYNGPQPYFFSYSIYTGHLTYGINYSFYVSLEYNSAGNFIKAGRDSFIYNSNNQVAQRFSRVQCDTCRSYLVNKYTYDAKGRLIADSSFTGQTFLVPTVVLHEYTVFAYDANDNVIQSTVINMLPGTYPPRINMAQYDNHPNPYKNLGVPAYLVYENPFVLSSNNVLPTGYTGEYYSNGLPQKIIFKNYTQTFFYE